MEPVRVLIVEDSAAFARGLEAVLSQEGAFRVVGVTGNRVEALALAEAEQPDVALVDLRIFPAPGAGQADFRHGVETIAALKARSPALPVVAMSSWCTGRWPAQAVRAGASGFLDKDTPPEQILLTLHMVARRAEDDAGSPG
jgi:DNA-binding NarL/FixJ family response regulator